MDMRVDILLRGRLSPRNERQHVVEDTEAEREKKLQRLAETHMLRIFIIFLVSG
jgi:hypothetical protein